MNEFTTMYQYFKGISETSDDKNMIVLKAVEHKAGPCHYLEMKSSNESDSNNNELVNDREASNAIGNLSYLNIDIDSFDTVDSAPAAMEMQPLKKRDSKDLINNLNNMKIKEEDEKEITNELKITEENYYDSNEFNKTATTIMDDFSNVCSDTLENISQTETLSTNSIPSSNSDNQQQSLYNDYLIQPSNVPVAAADAFADYLIQPSNIPVIENWPQKLHTAAAAAADDEHNYLNQPASRNQESLPESSHLRLYFKKKSVSESKASTAKEFSKPPSAKLSRSTNTLKRNDSDASSKKSVDDELLEIITDFKNNVFTIQECEELVNTWKNRNDVKKSFREKQEQLQIMREEYEKIQQRLKENLKRPSPFERVKRIFSKKHEKPTIAFSLPINLTGESSFSMLPNSNSGHRPNSTLSLHSASSNSSSGRMSTSSQASAGDSGTHSDHEENRSRQANGMMENYLIPPAPRPILSSLSTNGDEKGSLMSFSMNQMITTPTSADVLNEHYILFPSNIPIFPTSPILPPSPQSSSLRMYGENTFITFKGNK
jgi:phosphoinositide 3-kinase adaptor protein 1